MLRCGVAFMLSEAVAGVSFVELAHEAVASDFGEDTGCSNRIAFGIALHNRCLRIRQPTDFEAVYQGVFRAGLQLIERGVHRFPRRLTDVEPVNHLGIHACDCEADFGMRGDAVVKLFAFFFAELFGIVESPEF